MCIKSPFSTSYCVFTGSPFAVPIIDGQLVNACGPGLQRAVAHMPATFTIDTCYVGGVAPLCVSIIGKQYLLHLQEK